MSNQKTTLLLLLFLSHLIAAAQPYYQRGYRSVTYNDPSRSGRAIQTDLYYPATAAGTNVAVATGNNRFPVVVFGHGFSLPTSAYTRLADTLTRYGFIAAFPGTETGLAPSHDNFGKDLSFVATSLIQADSDPTSFLYQRVTSKAAVGGHSMGGGCSFLAAGSGNPNIYALFNMAAAETTPSAINAALSVTVPSLVFSGSSDCIVPPATQQSMYNNIVNGCKSQVTITGATHCQIANDNFTCVFGQISSGCNSSSINVTTVYTKVTQLLIPFLDYQLNGLCTRGIDFVSQLSTISGVAVTTNCPLPNCAILASPAVQLLGKLLQKSVKLDIAADNTNGNYRQLTLEKSENGVTFVPFFTTSISGPYIQMANITDPLPFAPHSYYRAVLLGNNAPVYSKIISVAIPQDLTLILPKGNIINNQLPITLTCSKKTSLLVSVMGSDGRVLIRQRMVCNRHLNLLLPFWDLPNGTYLIQVKDLYSELFSSTQCIKIQ